MAGYVKLWRDYLDHEVFQDADLWRLFSWCQMSANYMPSTYRGVAMVPGQFVMGRVSAAQTLKTPEATLERRLKKLEKWGLISRKANSQFTVITVCNWQASDDFKIQTDTTIDTTIDTTGDTTTDTAGGQPLIQPVDTDKEGNNLRRKEGKKDIPASPGAPPEKPEEPKPRKPPVETWLTPYGDIWFQVFEGEMPFSVFARDLKKLETKHGKVMVAVRWRRYCEAHVGKAQFANAAKFAQTYGQWSEDSVNAEHDPRGNIAAGKRFKDKMRQQAQGKTLEGSDIIEGEIVTK